MKAIPEPADREAWDDAVAFLSPVPSGGSTREQRSGYHEALKVLGHPERKTRFVHVAGTNGKGSTTFAIARILEAAGLRTGAYCSPYVFDLRERWLLGCEPVDVPRFLTAVATVRAAVDEVEARDQRRVTEFERKTLVAFQLFADARLDIGVLEVGIGGRLDATNAIPPPLAAAITSIGLDHCDLLGPTRDLVAGEKAGILKPGTGVCVTPVDDPEAGPVIAAKAALEGVPLMVVHPEDPNWNPILPDGLPGFQRSNYAVAAQIALALKERGLISLANETLRSALAKPGLPGRFARYRVGQKILLLDVAHNGAGSAALVDAIRNWYPDAPIVLVAGASKNHSPDEFLSPWCGLANRCIATQPSFRPVPAERVATVAEALGMTAVTVPRVADAVRAGLDATPDGGICCVSGSFFVVGEVPRELLEFRFA